MAVDPALARLRVSRRDCSHAVSDNSITLDDTTASLKEGLRSTAFSYQPHSRLYPSCFQTRSLTTSKPFPGAAFTPVNTTPSLPTAMGNIGNENRAYKPCNSPNTVGAGSSPTANRIHLDLPTSNSDSSPMLRRAAGRIPNIGIVGAGVAGLRCAEVLLKHGAKVTIFEGRNRVGGRFCQGQVGDHLVDL